MSARQQQQQQLDTMSSSSTLSSAFSALTDFSSASSAATSASASSDNASPSILPASPSDASHASVTPSRKHRKMLKDGTSEVWPEYLERIFVEGATRHASCLTQRAYSLATCPSSPLFPRPPPGLHAYWQSPWASYTKGRSRWRNQFLVDYLHNAGIIRSKKQVASHIQVLRNMWKGQQGARPRPRVFHIHHMCTC
jgi:hypothetical protein